MEHGISESQQYINWGKIFVSVTLFGEGDTTKALETLENTIEDYLRALDNNEKHPFLESLYQQVGNMCYKLGQREKAAEAFEKLVACKEDLYGKESKEIVGPLMQLQNMSSGTGNVDASMIVANRTLELLKKVSTHMDNEYIQQSGGMKDKEKAKVEKEIKMYNKYKLDVLFTIHNLHKIKKDFS